MPAGPSGAANSNTRQGYMGKQQGAWMGSICSSSGGQAGSRSRRLNSLCRLHTSRVDARRSHRCCRRRRCCHCLWISAVQRLGIQRWDAQASTQHGAGVDLQGRAGQVQGYEPARDKDCIRRKRGGQSIGVAATRRAHAVCQKQRAENTCAVSPTHTAAPSSHLHRLRHGRRHLHALHVLRLRRQLGRLALRRIAAAAAAAG